MNATYYSYTCPHCSMVCSVEEVWSGQNVVCPDCGLEFFASPPDQSQIILPEKLPFFKSGRRKLLDERLHELVADGELSEADEQVLNKTALLLGLQLSDVKELAKKGFMR